MKTDSIILLPGVDAGMSYCLRYAQEQRTCHDVDGTARDQGVSRHPVVPMLGAGSLPVVHGSVLELEVTESVSTEQ